MRGLYVVVLAVIIGMAAPAAAATISLYSNDFDGNVTLYTGVTGGLSGVTTTTSVLGFSADGFTGTMLYNNSGSLGNPASPTTLTLSNLPPHSSIKIDFLFAFIQSWDSTDGVSWATPDYFNVKIDGTSVLQITAANASGTQTYGGTQINGVYSRGFGGFNDRAFDMSTEPALTLAHTASPLVVDFYASGAGWQGNGDEWWGIENLKVTAEVRPVPIPGAVLLFAPGLLSLAAVRRRFKK